MARSDYSIRTFKGGYDENLNYLATCMRTGDQLIVDASVPGHQIQPFIRSELITLLITHTHGDHIAYLSDYVNIWPNLVIILYQESEKKIHAPLVKPVQDGDIITVGQLRLKVMYTPGHYTDSLCFYMDGVVFTGDTLFIGRTGRTLSDGSDTRQLYRSVYKKLLTLPKETIIYPGHDYGPRISLSIEDNIRISPLLKAQNENDFVQRMADYEATRHPNT